MKRGDIVYIVYRDTRIRPHKAQIMSIGSKYIRVDMMHPSQNRFDIQTFESVPDSNGYDINAKLYENEEAYMLELERTLQLNSLRQDLHNWIDSASIEKLVTFKDFIENGEKDR